MADKEGFVPAGVPADIVWRVNQSRLLYKPGDLLPVVDSVINPALVIKETYPLLMGYFRQVQSTEDEVYMRDFLGDHTNKFAIIAIQGLINRERAPRSEVEPEELTEIFDSARPFKRRPDEAANEAYDVARLVFSMLPYNTGLTPPQRPIHVYNWLRSINWTVNSIASGLIGRRDYVRNRIEVQRTLAFFTTGAINL